MTDYLRCLLRKDQGKVPVEHCHKKQCLFLASDGGVLKCDYGNLNLNRRPQVKKISRDGVV
jgi:hypothetical protein